MRRQFPFLRLAGSLLAGTAIFAAFMNPAFAAHDPGGNGLRSVSGYAVSGIRYQLSATQIDRLAGVSFRLDKPARVVRAGLGNNWGDCTVAGTSVSCTFGDEPTLGNVSALQVVATG